MTKKTPNDKMLKRLEKTPWTSFGFSPNQQVSPGLSGWRSRLAAPPQGSRTGGQPPSHSSSPDGKARQATPEIGNLGKILDAKCRVQETGIMLLALVMLMLMKLSQKGISASCIAVASGANVQRTQ